MWRKLMIACLIGVFGCSLLSWEMRAFGGEGEPSKARSGVSLPRLPNPFTAIGQGLKKLGDGLVSLVPHKKSAPEPSRYYPPGAVKKAPEKKPFWDWLAKPKESPKKIESVYDWMGQEQVLP